MTLEEQFLRALMKRDAKIHGKLDDTRKGEVSVPKGTRGKPWEKLGIARSVFYKRLKDANRH